MSDTDFVHLHVASGFSMRYGASTPQDLVDRAAAHGQHALALTDRDGLYGAVRFAMACGRAGISPILGVDLAVGEPAAQGRRAPRVRAPVRGGAVVDLRLPRVTVLARGRGAGTERGLGWAALCRLVTDTHLRGERGTPVTLPDLLARWARGGARREEWAQHPEPSRLRVLLGPDSDVGRAVLARRPTEARALLERWRALLPAEALAVEIVMGGGPEGSPGSRAHSRRMLGLADELRVPAVLTAAVRHATRDGVRTVDVLDAARRLVVLDSRHLDRVTDAGHLASSEEMWTRALEVAGEHDRAARLVATTRAVAGECVLDARSDLGIGAVHLPEPSILGIDPGDDPQRVLTERCRAAVGARFPSVGDAGRHTVLSRLDDELRVIADLGYPTYFLTVAEVTDLIKARGVRVAARGSGAGSLVNYLLGISGVDPIRHDLLMERFCSPLRAELPDIDVDVESARRTEIYQAILDRFGGDRVTCVSMMDTYKVRHSIRDVGAALGMPPVEVDEIAKAFPHIRARDARSAIADLPELRSRGLDAPRLDTFFELVERLDGLPRHIALHPCGVVLSNAGLLDRTPVEASWLGFPMSQFDKDDVETLGLLKLDVLGIRMQSAMAHAVAEVRRVDGVEVDLDDEAKVPLDDEATFRLIRSTHTLGCFQIESPGQRELIGKFGPERFGDLIIDISLFRPGPVKSDMITPFLESRHGWSRRRLLHPSLEPALAETEGVVVFHEQVLRIVAETTGVTLAQADEVRRTMGTSHGQAEIEAWWRPAARARGYAQADVDRIWEVLKSFASFGFCKAHAAAFALPTYHSAWLKTHHPAAFLAGVLTHDPGMYPKRLILDDARSLGIAVLGLDVNASGDTYRVERLDGRERTFTPMHPDLPDASDQGIRLSLTDVKGISDAEVASIVAGQPYSSLGDFWSRTTVNRAVVERLVLAGGFDSMHGIGATGSGLGRRGRITRRDLLLHVGELDRWERASTGRSSRRRVPPPSLGSDQVRERAAAQSQAARPVVAATDQSVQLTLDLGDRPELTPGTGLPEMTGPERVRAELDVLGLDASAHVVEFYGPMLDALGVVRSRDLLRSRSRSEVWIAGVKVATQTPPIRTGRRVVFLTLDDATGPVDATFFEDVQGPYAATIFHSWLLLVRGVVRRTGPRGISVRATGAWELAGLWDAWRDGGHPAVVSALEAADAEAVARAEAGELQAAEQRHGRRVLVHASGFTQSPYADIKPAGAPVGDGRLVASLAIPEHGTSPRKLWHSSPGSSGH
ncbi:DNA polymerase III subunit alpha [Knoellia aerolata]|uniref:DNA polymerase III subunit alpha n=1 Tax=Knoellia aerolata DSM 18566 TaxID=1385519 RepID=A0A0A0JSC3_9MICO|nr:DNA polymerase III subunit alpha [Knoellia aerolata]KGN40063.1 DNA polymerase III subunit alpha [Knoellia aerolata DSM 18566]